MSLTVQNITDGVTTDFRSVLSTGANPDILIDWTNRIQLDLLQFSNWRFLISGPQRFITEWQRTNYWVGATGGNTSTSVDTGLNITNLQRVLDRTVRDRSNARELFRTQDAPNNLYFQGADAQPRPGRPRLWMNSQDTPSVINIFPAPDNQNTVLPSPNNPVIERAAGGALGTRTYYVVVTLVDNTGGESSPCSEANIEYFTNGQLAKVRAPTPIFGAASSGILYNFYNIYAGTNASNMTLQNVTPVSITADWTEPGTGLTTSGVGSPASSTIAPMYGYIIEFRYLQSRVQLAALTDILQIPQDYKDVMIAGVNAVTAKYLGDQPGVGFWGQLYEAGKSRMIKDKNYLEGTYDLIAIDPAATPINQNSMELLDYNQLMP